jgi:hypothetical protein
MVHMSVQVGLANSRSISAAFGWTLATSSYCMWYISKLWKTDREVKQQGCIYRIGRSDIFRATHACVVLTTVDHPRPCCTHGGFTYVTGWRPRTHARTSCVHGRGYDYCLIFWDSSFGSFCLVGSSLKRLATYAMRRPGRDSRGTLTFEMPSNLCSVTDGKM